MDTFTQIGDAYKGFIDVDKAARDMKNLIEAKIKVRYNYRGFIPAAIRIKDKDEHYFIVHTVTKFSGKWLAERDVKIHESFKRQATIDFDEFNPQAKQYHFVEDLSIPTGEFEKMKPNKLMTKLIVVVNFTLAKDINEMNHTKSSKKESKWSKMVERWMEKRNEFIPSK